MNRTEGINHCYRGLDTWADGDVLAALWDGQRRAVDCLRPALGAIAAAARAMAERLAPPQGRLIFAGAGSAGRLAGIEGMELGPTFGFPDARIRLLLAGGETLALGGHGGVEDDGAAAERRMAALAPVSADAVVAVAASGTTAFTLAAARSARAAGALVIGIANNPATPLLAASDHPILLDSGAEVISGSTRMGAGTAQKAALNLLTTLTMIRLGHVHDGLMVDLRVENAKLRDRAVAMLMEITGCGREAAAEALARSADRVKTAALLLKGARPDDADRLLKDAGGNLRIALGSLAASRVRSGASQPPNREKSP
jgi:N-acetylmuramic acid 6-phosphate etherase